jgi:hypothetical protein
MAKEVGLAKIYTKLIIWFSLLALTSLIQLITEIIYDSISLMMLIWVIQVGILIQAVTSYKKWKNYDKGEKLAPELKN